MAEEALRHEASSNHTSKALESRYVKHRRGEERIG